MFNISLWQSSLSGVAEATLGGSLAFLPNLIGAILVVVLGLIIGRWTKTIIVKSLNALKLDRWVSDSKVKDFLHKAEVTTKIEEIVGTLAKWLVVMIFFIASTNILGLTTVSTLLAGILGYIPSVISAVIVLAIGVFLAGLIVRVVKGALASVDLHTSRLMGKVASYTVVTIAVLAAFSELNIASSFINILFIGFVACLSLGIGLAIGLGGKDVVAEILGKWYANLSRDLKK